MHSLLSRIEDLRGLHVRVHIIAGDVPFVDGICRGVEDDCVVLAPSSRGERTAVPLQEVATVTQLPGEFEG